jgi:hypothetical protein
VNNNYWVTFKGTRLEVARQLGRYWAERLLDGNVGKIGKLNRLRRRCPDVMNYVDNCHKEIAEEIECIVDGVNSVAGVGTANYNGIFSEILGEAGCATIAAHSGDFGVLSHNEEWVWDQPLCFAHVTLTDSRPHHKFLSVSYPFQLFGSSCGATSQFAFSGNSIELDESLSECVEKTVAGRIPKTILTRMLLDANSVEEASALLRRYPLLQANNLCFLTADGVYTEQFVPSEKLDSMPENQVTRIKHDNDRFSQTNFILRNNKLVYGTYFLDDKKEAKADKKRWKNLDSIVRKIQFPLSADQLELIMRNEGKDKMYTSATITFEMNSDGMCGRAVHYFTGSEIRVLPIKV